MSGSCAGFQGRSSGLRGFPGAFQEVSEGLWGLRPKWITVADGGLMVLKKISRCVSWSFRKSLKVLWAVRDNPRDPKDFSDVSGFHGLF